MRTSCRLLAGASVLVTAGISNAQQVDLSTLQLNGDAALVGSRLRVAPQGGFNSGSAFLPDPVSLVDTSFSSMFEFQISGGSGADGLVFVVHNSFQGATALGGGGGDLGFHDTARPPGINPSFGIEFDTWRNPFDPSDNHVGFGVNGATISAATSAPPFDLRGNSRFAWIDYDSMSGSLEVFLSETQQKPVGPLLAASIDAETTVGEEALFGFTAATGGSDDDHDVLAWSLTTTQQRASEN